MRKLLLLVMLVCGSVISSAQNGPSVRVAIAFDREAPNDPEGPKTRSLTPENTAAFVENQVVTIFIEEAVPMVTVRIINESTGETVYSQEHPSPSVVSIDLNDEDAGLYRIEIIAGDACISGEFTL